jgi:hypothetical protein
MSYAGETSSKASHSDIVRNPDVQQFLDDCDYLREPSDEEAEAIAARFVPAPTTDGVELPERIIAVDGSLYESSIDDRLPSTKVGFIKIGLVLIKMAEFSSLRVQNGRFVDPFRVAKLEDDNRSLNFPMPSANIKWKEMGSVREGFRAATDAFLCDKRTRFNREDPKTSLRTTLFHLAARRAGELGTDDPSRLQIHKCPSCNERNIEVQDAPDDQHCPHCGARVFPTDCLRLWEEVNENQSNRGALMRFMQDLEHLMILHYVRYLYENSLNDLAATAFFIDRPLAVYGNSAWLHLSIMRYLSEVNETLAQHGKSCVLIIGLQKTGQVADHVGLINPYLPANRIFPIDDDYRHKYITPTKEQSDNGFGYETYYGQDFIFKTPSERSFVFAIPYPFRSKDSGEFLDAKVELDNYTDLGRALKLIKHFESDLYENAVVPIALAHRHTAISLAPGGQVLDLLTQDALQ